MELVLKLAILNIFKYPAFYTFSAQLKIFDLYDSTAFFINPCPDQQKSAGDITLPCGLPYDG